MKKIRNYLFLFLFLFFGMMISVNAEEIEIESITCDNMYNGELRENVSTTVSGLTIAVNDSYFYKTGDYFKCTLVVKNNQDDDVMIDDESISSKSDEYVTYELTTTGENIIKKGESKTYNLSINYIKEVTAERTLENTVEIVIMNDKIEVPDTGVFYIITLFLLIVLLVSFVITIYTKKVSVLIVPIILSIFLIPTGYALSKVSIKMENKIYVDTEPRYRAIYYFNDLLKDGEASKYDGALKYDDSCITYDDEEYCYYDVTYVEGYYKVGDIVELEDREYTAFVDGDECAVCDDGPANQNNSSNSYGLKKLSGDNCECGHKTVLGKRTILDGPDMYWEYKKYENESVGDLEFDGGNLSDTTCYYQMNVNASSNNKNITLQRLSTCTSYYLRTPLEFKMPAHDMEFSPYLYDPVF